MQIHNVDTAVIKNLSEAGCNKETITAFMEELEYGRLIEGLKLLEKHRAFLLGDIHKGQKQIDCLDYLIYTLKNRYNLQNNIIKRRK